MRAELPAQTVHRIDSEAEDAAGSDAESETMTAEQKLDEYKGVAAKLDRQAKEQVALRREQDNILLHHASATAERINDRDEKIAIIDVGLNEVRRSVILRIVLRVKLAFAVAVELLSSIHALKRADQPGV